MESILPFINLRRGSKMAPYGLDLSPNIELNLQNSHGRKRTESCKCLLTSMSSGMCTPIHIDNTFDAIKKD